MTLSSTRAPAVLLALPILFAPLAVGSMRAPAVVLLCLLAVIAVGAQVRAKQRASDGRVAVPGLVLLLLIPAAVCLLQVIPLPRALVALLSPGVDAVHTSVTDLRLGEARRWATLALAPRDAALAGGRWVCIALVAFASWLAARREPRGEAAIRATEVALGLTLLVVALHAVTGGDLIYGLWPAGGRGPSIVQGPFVNSNHLAAFLLLMVPIAVTRTLDAEGAGERAIWLTMSAVGALVAAGTLSRAAFFALPLGLGLVAWGERRRLRLRKKLQLLGGVVAIGVVALALGGLVDYAADGGLWVLLQPELLFAIDGRISVYQAAGRILADYPLVGIGPGAFVDLHFQYAADPQKYSLLTAHSTYLQLVLDFGVVAGPIVLVGLLARGGLVLRSGQSPHRFSRVERGVLAGGAALLAQNILGFSLLVPGVAVPAVALAAVLDARRAGRPRLRWRPRTLAILGGVLLLLVTAGASWEQRKGRKATDAAMAALLAERPVDDERLATALRLAARTPADPWVWQTIGVALLPAQPHQALPLLNTSMQLDPQGPAPHWAAADALRILGAHSQAVIEYRMALERANLQLAPITGEVVRAYEDASTRCRAAPLQRPARLRYAHALVSRGADECGIELMDELQAQDPGDINLAITRARLLLRRGEIGPATAAAHQLLQDGATTEGHTLLARMADGARQTDEAEEQWRAALASATGAQRLRPLGEVGRILAAAKRSDDLRALSRAERAERPLDRRVLARCLHLESNAAELDGQLEEALQLARRAQALDSKVEAYGRAVTRLSPVR